MYIYIYMCYVYVCMHGCSPQWKPIGFHSSLVHSAGTWSKTTPAPPVRHRPRALISSTVSQMASERGPSDRCAASRWEMKFFHSCVKRLAYFKYLLMINIPLTQSDWNSYIIQLCLQYDTIPTWAVRNDPKIVRMTSDGPSQVVPMAHDTGIGRNSWCPPIWSAQIYIYICIIHIYNIYIYI